MLNMALLLFSHASDGWRFARPLADWGDVPGTSGPVMASHEGSRASGCWSGCLLQALIIALLVELPLGIDDLVFLLEQPPLGGEPQRDEKHQEDEHQEQGHERLLPVELCSTWV